MGSNYFCKMIENLNATKIYLNLYGSLLSGKGGWYGDTSFKASLFKGVSSPMDSILFFHNYLFLRKKLGISVWPQWWSFEDKEQIYAGIQFQINIFLARLSLTFKRDVKNLAQFQKTKCIENGSYQKVLITNVLLLTDIYKKTKHKHSNYFDIQIKKSKGQLISE